MSIYEFIGALYVIGVINLGLAIIYLLMRYIIRDSSRIYDRNDILYRLDQIKEKHNKKKK